ncbi:hypothetical protein S245_048861, partial [Arachis hypogaea]
TQPLVLQSPPPSAGQQQPRRPYPLSLHPPQLSVSPILSRSLRRSRAPSPSPSTQQQPLCRPPRSSIPCRPPCIAAHSSWQPLPCLRPLLPALCHIISIIKNGAFDSV